MPSRRYINLCVLLVMLQGTLCGAASARERKVTINHETGIVTPAGSVGLAKYDSLSVTLTKTYPQCFNYNAEPVTKPATDGKKGRKPPSEDVVFTFIHDGVSSGYRFRATRRTDAPGWCSLPELDRTIQVETFGWQVALTGAFTADKLTDPVYFLEPGTSGGKTGSFIRENRDAQDNGKLGLAAMIHLYHSDPQALSFFGSRAVSWAPVTFGIGIDGSAHTKYFLGSSVRVGDKLFVTLGAVVGPVKRLPDGLTVGSFTENANALATLPTKVRGAGFLSLSYTFIDIGVNRFKGLFPEPAPTPKEDTQGKTGDSGTPPPPETDAITITIAPTEGPVDSDVKITLDKGTFTGDSAQDEIFVGGNKVTPKTAPKAGDAEVTISVGKITGKQKIYVAIKGTKSNEVSFSIK